jgi:hypothetical protein
MNKFWETWLLDPSNRNHCEGFFEIGGVGLINYHCFERDWNMLGRTEEENKAMGSYIECFAEVPSFESLPDGTPHISVASGKTQEEAVLRLKTLIEVQRDWQLWRKRHPNGSLRQFHEERELI